MGENLENKISWRGKLLVITMLLSIMLTELSVLASVSPGDIYAIEVVLNKPGIEYNLLKLASTEGVRRVDYFYWSYSAYAYRSRYDSRLIVVVSEQGLKCANVRVSEDEPRVIMCIKAGNLTLKGLSEAVEKAQSSGAITWKVRKITLGEAIGYIFAKNIGGAEVKVFVGINSTKGILKIGLRIEGARKMGDELASNIRNKVEGLLRKIGIPQSKKLLNISVIRESLVRGEVTVTQERYIAIRIQIPLYEERETITAHVCNIVYKEKELNVSQLKPESLRKLGWEVRAEIKEGTIAFMARKTVGRASLTILGKGKGYEVEEMEDDEAYVLKDMLILAFRITGVDEIGDRIVAEFKQAVKSLGLDEKLVDKQYFNRVEILNIKLKPAYAVSEKDLKEALKVELEWLLKNGIIKGLSEKDIGSIISAIKLGYAGWNRRLVWFDGEWKPYSEVPGALVLRGTYSLPSELMISKPTAIEQPEKSLIDVLIKISTPLAVSVSIATAAATVSYVVAKKRVRIEE